MHRCSVVCHSHDRCMWWVYNEFNSVPNKIYFIIYIRHHYFFLPSLLGACVCTSIALITNGCSILMFWRFVLSCCTFMCTLSVCPERFCCKTWQLLVWLPLSKFGCCLASGRITGVVVVDSTPALLIGSLVSVPSVVAYAA